MAGKPASGKGEKKVGQIEHYYPKPQAAAVGLTADLKVGDEIHIVGHGDDVRTKVKSLQLDHVPIVAGHAGQHIGVGLAKKVHEGDDVLVVKGSSPAAKKAASKPKARPKAAKRPKKAAKKSKGKAKPSKAKPKKARKKAGKTKKKGEKSKR